MEHNELKKCPFCGEIPLLMRTEYRHDEALYRVQCINKECRALPSTYNCNTIEAALSDWNVRASAESEQKIKELEEAYKRLEAENCELSHIADKYIKKCDELESERQRAVTMMKPLI